MDVSNGVSTPVSTGLSLYVLPKILLLLINLNIMESLESYNILHLQGRMFLLQSTKSVNIFITPKRIIGKLLSDFYMLSQENWHIWFMLGSHQGFQLIYVF